MLKNKTRNPILATTRKRASSSSGQRRPPLEGSREASDLFGIRAWFSLKVKEKSASRSHISEWGQRLHPHASLAKFPPSPTVLALRCELMNLSFRSLKHLSGGRKEMPWNERITENCHLQLRTAFLMVMLLLYITSSGLLKIEFIENHLSQERRGQKELGRLI